MPAVGVFRRKVPCVFRHYATSGRKTGSTNEMEIVRIPHRDRIFTLKRTRVYKRKGCQKNIHHVLRFSTEATFRISVESIFFDPAHRQYAIELSDDMWRPHAFVQPLVSGKNERPARSVSVQSTRINDGDNGLNRPSLGAKRVVHCPRSVAPGPPVMHHRRQALQLSRASQAPTRGPISDVRAEQVLPLLLCCAR